MLRLIYFSKKLHFLRGKWYNHQELRGPDSGLAKQGRTKYMTPKNTLHFTMKALEAIKPNPDRREFYYDLKYKNLCLAVNKMGSKTWFYYGSIKSRPERIRIGRYPEINLTEAKRRWKKLQGRIANGENPNQDKRDHRAEPTLKQFFEESFLERYAKIQKKSWEADVGLFRNHLTRIEKKRLSEVTDAQVSRLHRKIGADRPVVANRTVMLLSAIFNKAKKWKVYAGDNPASAVELFPESPKETYLSREEIRRLMESIREENDEKFFAFVQICLLTGVRSGNIFSMTWDQISEDGTQWEIPRENTKNKKPHVVNLTEQASEILNALGVEGHGEFVFHDGDSKKFGRRMRYLFSKSAKRIGVQCSLHTLRHTTASQMVSDGISLIIVQQALGHLSYRSTQRYSHVAPSSVRDSLRLVTNDFFEDSEEAETVCPDVA